ncbi:mitochondrial import inner membrane translocase subunit tim21 [Puttea exsequens]|nr:mitochondrial import inner membrane translocase subunit tim21 [Puttea exsequens]
MGLNKAIGAQRALLPTLRMQSNRPELSFGVLVLLKSRSYATTDNLGGSRSTSRKQVTVRNDDGRVRWGDLTTREKAARTTQQTFNFGVVLAGLLGTIGVAYVLYTEVFASDSKTSHFNRAVDRIRADPRALELLGSGQTIRAFGEPTSNKWTRNRPIASQTFTDHTGLEHFRMHFNVQGSEKGGLVNVHMVRGPDYSDWQYRVLALDVKGHPRLYLENADAAQEKKKKPGFRMLGVQWR